jgi:hypothetical protein
MAQHCCKTVHAADRLKVEENWWPKVPRCLIIGESPGNPGSLHFYDPIPSGRLDPVRIRHNLLDQLVVEGLLQSATLEDFRDKGYFFDHAVRCQIPMKIVITDRRRARSYRSQLVATQTHLAKLIKAFDRVWVMGHMARNALANLGLIAINPCSLIPAYTEGRRFFISPYVRRYRGYGPQDILSAFVAFQKGNMRPGATARAPVW